MGIRRHLFQTTLGAGLVALYRVSWAWHSPRPDKLTKPEIDHYMALVGRLLPPGEAKTVVSRIRLWAEADDGKPVYMFNLIHFFPQLRTFPGAPEFKGTPREANEHYTKSLRWLWLSHAAYPIFDGATQSNSLINMSPERVWDQVTVVRYPNRRTFLKLLSDPSYAAVEPYKFMAMELDLVPVSGDAVMPDVRWLLGGILTMVFLLVGWTRSSSPGVGPLRIEQTSERKLKS